MSGTGYHKRKHKMDGRIIMEELMNRLGIKPTQNAKEMIRRLEDKKDEYLRLLENAESEKKKQLENDIREIEITISSLGWMVKGQEQSANEHQKETSSIIDSEKRGVSWQERFAEATKLLKTTNYAEGVAQIQRLADEGYDIAQNTLGAMFFEGKGVPQNYEKAIEWYEKSAIQECAIAQLNLGMMYWQGNGVSKDEQKGTYWLQKAAEQGNAVAQSGLAAAYARGKGMPQDDKKAIEWFEKAGAQGNTVAQYGLGQMYNLGKGVSKDAKKAVEWYEKAAKQGMADAQNVLGEMYIMGKGVPEDYQKAAEWFQKAANQGHEKAKRMLAKLQERKKAVKSYQNASEQGITSTEIDRRALKIYLRNVLTMECVIHKFMEQEEELREQISKLETNNYLRRYNNSKSHSEFHFYYNGKDIFIKKLRRENCVNVRYFRDDGTAWGKVEDVLSSLNKDKTWYSIYHLVSRMPSFMHDIKEKNAIKKDFLKCYEEFKEIAPVEYEKNCQTCSELRQRRSKICSDMNEAKIILEKMYQINIVPGIFRNNLAAIYYLHDIVTTSNLSFEMAILNVNLEEIKVKLDKVIQQQQESIINQARLIAQNDSLQQSNDAMLKNLASIERNTEIATQYSKITATNTQTLVYMSRYY